MGESVYNDSVTVLPRDGAGRWPVRVVFENGEKRHGQVASWEELKELSIELGFDLHVVGWMHPAHDEMTQDLGPAPW
jgi:hypothetical protein